jgi:hypothetical protein
MDVESTYQKILEEIRRGHRGLVRLSAADIEGLCRELKERRDLERVLCIVEHSATPTLKFESDLLSLLSAKLSSRELVFTLTAASKHIVEARFQRGQRLQFEFLEALKGLLFHPEPEVVEWTLRLIEACGNQGVYFLREFDKIKPPPWKWFNAHQRAVREIITLLERRWSSVEKPNPGS